MYCSADTPIRLAIPTKIADIVIITVFLIPILLNKYQNYLIAIISK